MRAVTFVLAGCLALFGLLTNAQTDWPASTPDPSRPSCACTPKNIWLDIFFAFDSSLAITPQGFDAALDFMQAALARMTIGQGTGGVGQTRVGFITYSDSAQVRFNLTAFTSMDDVFNAFGDSSLYYEGRNGTNIEDAINKATTAFNSGGHRPNVKRVLVVLASAYQPSGVTDPTQSANAFKEDGSTLITVEYVQAHGPPVPELDKISSPNYKLTNIGQDLQANDLVTLFCWANCFCATNYNPYGMDKFNTPQGGCYYPETLPTLTRLAASHCRNQRNNGILPVVQDTAKSMFLANLFQTKAQYWIGLNNTGGSWVWSDGSPLTYTKWAAGQPNSNYNCVYQYVASGFNTNWYTDDCNNDHLYACQSGACDTDHYCP